MITLPRIWERCRRERSLFPRVAVEPSEPTRSTVAWRTASWWTDSSVGLHTDCYLARSLVIISTPRQHLSFLSATAGTHERLPRFLSRRGIWETSAWRPSREPGQRGMWCRQRSELTTDIIIEISLRHHLSSLCCSWLGWRESRASPSAASRCPALLCTSSPRSPRSKPELLTRKLLQQILSGSCRRK